MTTTRGGRFFALLCDTHALLILTILNTCFKFIHMLNIKITFIIIKVNMLITCLQTITFNVYYESIMLKLTYLYAMCLF